jgi:hypothetical protein
MNADLVSPDSSIIHALTNSGVKYPKEPLHKSATRVIFE